MQRVGWPHCGQHCPTCRTARSTKNPCSVKGTRKGNLHYTTENWCGTWETRIMPTSNEYRSFAEQCLHWADETDNEEYRHAFLEMAKLWTQLAMHGNEALQISEAAE
jgi:hypothetical protein